MWLFLLTLWSGATKPEKVIRCHDQIIDTGSRTANGHKILKLVRTNCHWELFYLPEKNKWETDRDYSEENE